MSYFITLPSLYFSRSLEPMTTSALEFVDSAKYPPLFVNPVICHHEEKLTAMKIVEMDEGGIVWGEKGKELFLGTLGVGPCIALCARGETVSHCYLGIFHLCLEPPKEGLEYLMNSFMNSGCYNVEIYLVGGNHLTLDVQEKLLELSNYYPIKGAKFNLVSEQSHGLDASINVAMNTKYVYWGKKLCFDTI